VLSPLAALWRFCQVMPVAAGEHVACPIANHVGSIILVARVQRNRGSDLAGVIPWRIEPAFYQVCWPFASTQSVRSRTSDSLRQPTNPTL
jgi:hypothetical protein